CARDAFGSGFDSW
nr:immunoglobulin heavy chain junction region [Macaca mulatta]